MTRVEFDKVSVKERIPDAKGWAAEPQPIDTTCDCLSCEAARQWISGGAKHLTASDAPLGVAQIVENTLQQWLENRIEVTDPDTEPDE